MNEPYTSVRLSLDAVRFRGAGLARPECVLCCEDGWAFASDSRGGVLCISPIGEQRLISAAGLMPNGLALLEDGSFLVANLGVDGGVWRLQRNGHAEPWLTEVDGKVLPGVNFVLKDVLGRVWVSVSTSRSTHEFRSDVADGFLVLVDRGAARVVADGLCWANECRLDASGGVLYVNETFQRRLTRFQVAHDGALRGRAVVTEFGHGTYPDGLALDEEGCIWVTSVVSNRVFRITPGGVQHLLLEDGDPCHIEKLEREFSRHALTRQSVLDNHSRVLGNVSSIAFAGPDRRTIHLGSLCGTAIAVLESPVAGLPMAHWEYAN